MKNLKINICVIVMIMFNLILPVDITYALEGDFISVDKLPENYMNIYDFEKENSLLIYFNYAFPSFIIQDTDGSQIGSDKIPYNENYLRFSKNRDIYVNIDSMQEYLIKAKKAYEERIHIYQIGDIIEKRNYSSINNYNTLNVSIDNVKYLNKYNGNVAGEHKKFFIIKINEDLSFKRDSDTYDSASKLIYEIFSTNGNKYKYYFYNEENKEYCFEINNNDYIEYVTISPPCDRLEGGEFLERTINVLDENIQSSMKLDKLEFKQNDNIPIDYINIEPSDRPAYKKGRKYKYLDDSPEINKGIYFDFHFPYIYMRDLDGGFLEQIKINDDRFLKIKDDEKFYADKKIVNKHLNAINQVNEDRKKVYKLGETITKIVNSDIQKKIEIEFDNAKYSYDYNGKQRDSNKKFFVIKLKKFNLEGFNDIENKDIQDFKNNIIKYLMSENGTNYEEYDYNSKDDTYCFVIDKNETITSLVIGTEKYYNADISFNIGEDFERTISFLN